MVGNDIMEWVKCGLQSVCLDANLDSTTYEESQVSLVILNSFTCKLEIITGSVFIRLLKLMTELHNLHKTGRILHVAHRKVSWDVQCEVALVGEGDRSFQVLVTEFCFCSTRMPSLLSGMEEIHLAGIHNKIKILITTTLLLQQSWLQNLNCNCTNEAAKSCLKKRVRLVVWTILMSAIFLWNIFLFYSIVLSLQ